MDNDKPRQDVGTRKTIVGFLPERRGGGDVLNDDDTPSRMRDAAAAAVDGQ